MNILIHFVHHELLNPTTGSGALFYGALFFVIASALGTFLRRGVKKLLKLDLHRHIDRTYALFITPLVQIAIYVFFLNPIFTSHPRAPFNRDRPFNWR